MRIFILGGTGSIGSAVVKEIRAGGHDVVGLARSERSAALMVGLGATPLRGNIREPENWATLLPAVDAVIHAASDFSDTMEVVENRLLDVLLPVLGAMPQCPRFIYTGGCWLYGETGNRIADERAPFDPPPAFAWSVAMIERVLRAREIEPLIIHPAMVYTHDGGVLDSFLQDAIAKRAFKIVSGTELHWPLVHADDLAVLYRLVLERGLPGQAYNGAAADGVQVGSIVRALARRFGISEAQFEIVSADAIAAERGEWARGYGLDQRMSGDKARREFVWRPLHTDPLKELAARG